MLDSDTLSGWLDDFASAILIVGSREDILEDDKMRIIEVGRNILCRLIMSNIENMNSRLSEPSMN